LGGDGWAIQFGDGSTPVQIAGDVGNFSVAGWHTLFVKNDRTLWGIGTMWGGFLPDTYVNYPSPAVQVQAGIVAVAANSNLNLYVKADGSLWRRGSGWSTWVGPEVQLDTDVAAMAAVQPSCPYLKRNGSLWSHAGSGGSPVHLFDGVTDVMGSTDSTFAFIQQSGFGTAPTIIAQPESRTIDRGALLTLQVAVSGSGPLAYQWDKDGVPIGDAQTAEYTIPYAMPDDAGAYTVVVRNSAGSVTSAAAVLTVIEPPVITSQTPWQTVFAGNSATFGVEATGPGLSYRWEQSTDGGASWTPLNDGGNYTGTATATLTVSGVSAAMSGWQFRCVIDNVYGSATSTAAALTTMPALPAPGLVWVQGNVVGELNGAFRSTPKVVFDGVASAAAGFSHSLFLKQDGTLWATGTNSSGQLGDGSTTDRSMPVQVASGVAAVAAGGNHTLFLKQDETLWAVGNNGGGQLGDGTTTNRSTPVQMASGVAAMSAGFSHTLFLKQDGTLWAVGANSRGQLGDGTTTSQSTPVQVASGVAAVAAGGEYTMFIKTDKTLWAVGSNDNGQLGDGTTTDRSTPVQVASGIVSVAAGSHHSLFLKTDGTLWAVGNNGGGQLGDGTTTSRSTPVQVASGIASVAAAAGGSHTLFLRPDGTLWAVGANSNGQLGDGTTTDRSTPVQVASGVVFVAAAGGHTLYVTTDGKLWATGANASGQLGDGTMPSLPNALLAQDAVAAAIGFDTSMFVRSDGTLWTQEGRQISAVPGVSGVAAVAVSNYNVHRLYLKADGTLWLLADDNTSTLAASGVVSCGTGLEYITYLKSDGTLWGQNISVPYQFGWIRFGDGVNPGQTADHVESVSAAGWHLLYVKSDRTLWGLGAPWGGFGDQADLPAHASSPIQVETGILSAVANKDWNQYIRTDGTLWTRGCGWSDWNGPAAEVDSGVVAMTGDPQRTLYVKNDGILWARSGHQGTLGSPEQVAGGVIAVGTGTDSNFLFIQQAGYGTTPEITAQPQSVLAEVGATTTLQVGVNGTGPLDYQWFKDGTAIPGAKNPQYSIVYATSVEAGGYSVVITNSAGSVTSAAAVLTVGVAPTITTQPTSQSVNAGADVAFTVLASGSEPLHYQWYKNGAAITGATSTSLALNNTQSSDAGAYTVVVTNSAGSVTSAPATLTVLSAPPTITEPPASQTIAVGQTATFTVTAKGTEPLSYQWRKGTGNIAGATAPTLTLANVQTSDAGNYRVVVSNSVGSVTSAAATLTVLVPPAITTQPVDVTVRAGQNATFRVVATGSSPLGYQWRKNGIDVAGATSAALTIAAAQSADAGSYDVIVSNPASSITSAAATLTVNVPPTITTPPASLTVVVGKIATFTVVASGTEPMSYQWRKGTTDIAGATAPTLTLANVQTTDAGNYRVVVSNAAGSVTSAAATLTVLVPPAITTQPVNVTVRAGQNATFRVVATGTSPLAYQWHKNGIDVAGATSAALTIAAAQSTDAGSYEVIVSNPAGSITSAAATLTVNVPPTIITPPASLTVVVGQIATFTVVASGTVPMSYQWRKGTTDIAGATAPTLTLTNVQTSDAGNYRVVISNAAGSVTSAVATLTVLVPPAITTQPADHTVKAGQTATFKVVATGTTPLGYQWRKNGADLAGATSATLQLTNAQPADAGSYDVVVNNAAGSVTSVAATLTVNVPPTVTTPPASLTVVVGQIATFTVVASGTEPMSYQWRKGTTDIAGATAPTLTLTNVRTSDAGNYRVVVSNAAGSVTSTAAKLTVNPVP
jgi:alpha-tubulin suppressor-like RCC1 family protein